MADGVYRTGGRLRAFETVWHYLPGAAPEVKRALDEGRVRLVVGAIEGEGGGRAAQRDEAGLSQQLEAYAATVDETVAGMGEGAPILWLAEAQVRTAEAAADRMPTVAGATFLGVLGYYEGGVDLFTPGGVRFRSGQWEAASQHVLQVIDRIAVREAV